MREIKTAYLKCNVIKTPRRAERAINFRDVEGRNIIGVFPKSRVRNNKIKVMVLSTEENKTLITVKISNKDSKQDFGLWNAKDVWVFDSQLVSTKV